MAQDKPPEKQVPDLVFSQQVNIVVSAKKDPRIFDVKVTQKDDTINLELIVDQNVEQIQAKQMANDIIILAKSQTLDDPPKNNKSPGKGLYNYHLNITHPDGVQLFSASKPKDKSDIIVEDQNPVLRPLTRADAGGQ
jgi:hypothetical protein